MVSTILAVAMSRTCYAQSSPSNTRLRVAVIDTGLSLTDPRFKDVLCPSGHKDFTGEGIWDVNSHGTHVAGIIMRNAPDHSKYCLVIIKAFGTHRKEYAAEAIQYAVSLGIKLVNISADGITYDPEEKAALSASGVKFVVAAGNENSYYKNSYPSGYGLPNVYPVGNWDCKAGKKGRLSNYGGGIIWRCGTDILSTVPGGNEETKSGTSMAAPMYTAELINRGGK